MGRIRLEPVKRDVVVEDNGRRMLPVDIVDLIYVCDICRFQGTDENPIVRFESEDTSHDYVPTIIGVHKSHIALDSIDYRTAIDTYAELGAR